MISSGTVIITDSCCDLPAEYIKEHQIISLGVNFYVDGEEYQDDHGQTLSYKEFYDSMRQGIMPTTSQVNYETYKRAFTEYVLQGKAIIYIGFSSGLSGCVNTANIVKQEILEEYPKADITIIDTLCASVGEGLLVYYACTMLEQGSSKEEIVLWLTNNKNRVNHWFTVENLDHLKRGGRISSTAAMIGTMLNIKPILSVNNEGKLVSVAKVKGRKKSISFLVDALEEYCEDLEEQVLFICHGDSLQDAEYLKELILKRHTVKGIMLNCLGPGIGTHTGPGIIGLVFLGKEKVD